MECAAPDPLGPLNPVAPPGDCCPAVSSLVLYDDGVPFVRVLSISTAGAVLSVTDYDLDGAPYVVAGTVTATQQTVSEAHAINLPVDAVTFTAPANAESVSVLVETLGGVDTVSIVTADGTILANEGDVFTWSIAGPTSITLSDLEVITSHANDRVIVTWTERI